MEWEEKKYWSVGGAKWTYRYFKWLKLAKFVASFDCFIGFYFHFILNDLISIFVDKLANTLVQPLHFIQIKFWNSFKVANVSPSFL